MSTCKENRKKENKIKQSCHGIYIGSFVEAIHVKQGGSGYQPHLWPQCRLTTSLFTNGNSDAFFSGIRLHFKGKYFKEKKNC